MKCKNPYIVHFKGLKEGIHEFEYNIGKSFFEEYKNLDIPDGNINVLVKLNKKASFMELDINLSGEIQVQCDRCLAYFSFYIANTSQLVIKFSTAEKEADNDVIYLHQEENQLDLKHYLYECIGLAIPLKKVHPDHPNGSSGCDPEMLRLLQDHSIH